MPSPLSALVDLSRRREAERADKLAVSCASRGGRAVLDVDREAWASGRLTPRITSALAIVQTALGQSERPIIAFSGGKDSLCTMALVHAINPLVPVLWSDDELEYPEIVSYMRSVAICALGGSEPDFIWLQGGSIHGGWFRPWAQEPFFREPDYRMVWRKPHQADSQDWARDEGYDLTFLGTRMGESRKRRDHLAASHAFGPVQAVRRGTGQHCTPVWDWTEADIWALIAGWNLPYVTVYDRLVAIGVERHRQRIGPLPLADRTPLQQGWPDLFARLVARYGDHRWTDGRK